MESLLEILIQAGEHFDESFVVADLRENDGPLVYVNEAFVKLTGYSKSEIIGKNCRFLQGELSDSQTLKMLRESISKRQCCFFDLLNYKKNGAPFWNRLLLFPVGYSSDDLCFYVGIQISIFEGENTIQYFDTKSPKGETEKEVKNPFDRIIQAERIMKYAGFIEDESLKPSALAKEIMIEVTKIKQFLKNV